MHPDMPTSSGVNNNVVTRFIMVLLQRVLAGEINLESAESESRGSPFPMPAELADGLDQGSDLKTIAWLLRPRPFHVEQTCGSPAPACRKADRLRLQCALDRHAATIARLGQPH